jgi:hypothetical protein
MTFQIWLHSLRHAVKLNACLSSPQLDHIALIKWEIFNSTANYRQHVVCLLFQSKVSRVRSIASSFDFHYLHLSLTSSNSCLRPLPCLPVPSIFPSITHFRRQFLRKMWQHSMSGQTKCWSFQLMSNLHKIVNRSAKNATPVLLAESHTNTYIRLLLLIIYIDSSMVHLLCWWSHTTGTDSCH